MDCLQQRTEKLTLRFCLLFPTLKYFVHLKMSTIKLETTPVDPRFPNTNQAQHCWTRYNEWVVCTKKHKDDEDACKKARQYAASLCPNE